MLVFQVFLRGAEWPLNWKGKIRHLSWGYIWIVSNLFKIGFFFFFVYLWWLMQLKPWRPPPLFSVSALAPYYLHSHHTVYWRILRLNGVRKIWDSEFSGLGSRFEKKGNALALSVALYMSWKEYLNHCSTCAVWNFSIALCYVHFGETRNPWVKAPRKVPVTWDVLYTEEGKY